MQKERFGLETQVLSPKMMEDLVIFRVEDSDKGFQRKLSLTKVNAIISHLKKGVKVWPLVLLGRLPDKRLIIIDGQHRIEAHKKAKIPLGAQIVNMDLEKARELFLVHNSGATKVSVIDCYKASRNNLALSLKKIEKDLNVPNRWLIQLVKGLDFNPDFVDVKASLNEEALKLIRTISKKWTNYKYWEHENKNLTSSYRDVRIAFTLGYIHRLAGKDGLLTVIKYLQSGSISKQAQRWRKKGEIHTALLNRERGKKLAQRLLAGAACQKTAK